MNRRSFLRAATALPAATLLPIGALAPLDLRNLTVEEIYNLDVKLFYRAQVWLVLNRPYWGVLALQLQSKRFPLQLLRGLRTEQAAEVVAHEVLHAAMDQHS